MPPARVVRFGSLALLALGVARLDAAPPQPDKAPPLKSPGLARKQPLADLQPQAPRVRQTATPFDVDLARVPEVALQEPLSRKLTKEQAAREIARQLARIRHANEKKADAFLEALIAKRADLQGMPFQMGGACRIRGDRARLFGLLATGVRVSLAAPKVVNSGELSTTEAEVFWRAIEQSVQEARKDLPRMRALLDGKDESQTVKSQDCGSLGKDLDAALVAALMQVLATESPPVRQGLVKFLSKTPNAEATRALARLALFAPEDEVRRPAALALKGRRRQDYEPILMEGFRYPLPAVAGRAAEAVARLGCKDLAPRLADLLDEPDPRLPAVREVNRKKVPVLRELVRVNHHRNCMLCHAPATVPVPGTAGKTRPDTVEGKTNVDLQRFIALATTAPVPLPGEPLPPPSEAYNPSQVPQERLVRIDTTYLRQDFSLLQPVADAAPWPDRQRFDFFVRSRVLSEQEAEHYRRQAPADQAGKGNPYRRAVLSALRGLTGRDAPPTARAWRELLASPAQAGTR